MPEEVRFAAALRAAMTIQGWTGAYPSAGEVLRLGQATFAVLAAIYESERRMAGVRGDEAKAAAGAWNGWDED